ncbi:hypothetical protein N8561_01580 [bacterium]|nr:hypothetical protein [bacterium]
MKAADFAGCVQTMSGKSSPSDTKSCGGIRKGLAIIKERIISGTSLTKLDVNTNPLSDALAVAKAGGDAKESCSKLLADSQSVLDMIRVLRSQWQVEIENGAESAKQGKKVWPASLVEPKIKAFNMLAGGTGIPITGPGEIQGMSNTSSQGFDYEVREFRGGIMGCMGLCGNWVVSSVKGRMVQVIAIKIESALDGIEPDWSQR